jgi:purine-nucleoside phosphorylase
MENSFPKKSNVNAASAARQIRQTLHLDSRPYRVGVILGTGWGDALKIDDARSMDFKEVPGFSDLRQLEGHDRQIVTGRIGQTDVVALRGRVHLYESADASIYAMVRLQAEMLIHLGVRQLILTNSAGALGHKAKVGDLVLVDGFYSLAAGRMPIFGDHPSPDDAIDHGLRERILGRLPTYDAMQVGGPKTAYRSGGYAMVQGPCFEGRKYDKTALVATGCSVVGMSTLPETCVAALYRDDNVRVLPVSFVSNDDKEEHSHQLVIGRTRSQATMLADFLGIAIREAARFAG